MVHQLASIAKVIKAVIRNAEQSGLRVDDGNVTQLLADNLPKDICYIDIGSALVVAGFSKRFPVSIRRLAFSLRS
jgi:hypothetical protein